MLFLKVVQKLFVRGGSLFGPSVAIKVLASLDFILHGISDKPEFVHFCAYEFTGVAHG